jgi:Uma2 family endonuclease
MATTRPHSRLRAEDVAHIPVPDDIAGYELIGGELVPVMGSWHQHAWLAFEVAKQLDEHVRAVGAGRVLPGVWCKLAVPGDPERLYAPDIAFFTSAKANAAKNGRIFHDPPDLAVEIYSETNRRKLANFAQRIRDYLDAGISLLWIIYPDARYAIAHRADGSAHIVRDTEVLIAEDVLPGFRLELAPLFDQMPPTDS